VVNVEEMRYSKPSEAQVFDVRRRDFRAGREQWIRMERRSSVGRVSIVDRGEDVGQWGGLNVQDEPCGRWRSAEILVLVKSDLRTEVGIPRVVWTSLFKPQGKRFRGLYSLGWF